MKLVIIGASGFVGSAVLAEALARGHQVTALVRNPGTLQEHSNLKAVAVDVHDIAATSALLKSQDALISSFKLVGDGNAEQIRAANVAGYHAIFKAINAAGLKRILVVGGAGSLEIAPGVQLVSTPQFPAAVKPYALAVRDVLEYLLREAGSLDWSYVSPAAILKPGEKRGGFRIGSDQVLMNETGPGVINVGDLAVAIIDEIETSKHLRKRFTVAY